MNEIVLRSGCKINLTLHITGVRPDGMHELDSVFYPLQEPHDVLYITRQHEEKGLTVDCGEGIDPDKNTLTRAYGLYAQETGFAPDLHVRLEKGVPSGAGLGGGSADAATLLQWLDAQNPLPLSEERLSAIAARVGADVPFFLKNMPCRAQGIGERLTPLPELSAALRGMGLLLACPPTHISTPWAYAAWDQHQKSAGSAFAARKDLTTACTLGKEVSPALLGEEIAQGRNRLYNAFEEVVFPAYPEVAALKPLIHELGACAVAMSGSGAAVYGLFPKDACTDERVFAQRLNQTGASFWWQRL